MLISVLLPAPFGPISAWMCPRVSVKLMSVAAVTPPKDFVTPRPTKSSAPVAWTSRRGSRGGRPELGGGGTGPRRRFSFAEMTPSSPFGIR